MTKEQKDRILKTLTEDRNYYAIGCNRRVEREWGKIEGADYMLQRFLDALRTEESEDKERYEITVEPNLKKIIDDFERIEKKYAKPQERSNKKSCDNCKHNTESWDSDACDGCCEANSKWSGESYPGEFEAMEHNGRLDALESEDKEWYDKT